MADLPKDPLPYITLLEHFDEARRTFEREKGANKRDAAELAEYRQVLQEHLPMAIAMEALESFDAHKLPLGIQEFLVQRTLLHSLSPNYHFVLEIFCTSVTNGMSPPRWVLDTIARAFSDYLKDPQASPKSIGQKLGLEGPASGSANPRDDLSATINRAPAMVDMAMLMRHFAISQNNAADAVRLKYQISRSPSTIKKWFAKFWGEAKTAVCKPLYAIDMTEYRRTKFVESFPPKARRHLIR